MLKVLLRLTSLAVLSHRLSAATMPCHGGVFCIPETFPDDCGSKHTDVCTTLVLYNSTGYKFQLQGSGNIELEGLKFGLKNINKAEQVGTAGCYTLFKGKNQHNEQYQIKDIGTTHVLQEEDKHISTKFGCVTMRTPIRC